MTIRLHLGRIRVVKVLVDTITGKVWRQLHREGVGVARCTHKWVLDGQRSDPSQTPRKPATPAAPICDRNPQACARACRGSEGPATPVRSPTPICNDPNTRPITQRT